MELKGNYNRFVRYGLLLIGLAGFVFAIDEALIQQEGDMLNAAGDPEGFAELVTTDNYQFWALRGLANVIWGSAYLWMAAYSWKKFSYN